MINISNYRTRSFAVECRGGVFADSATGRQMELLDGAYIVPDGGAKVNKATVRSYYTAVWSLTDSALQYTVLRASAVNKRGLVWCEEFFASFVPGSAQVRQRGKGTVAYWLAGEGCRMLMPDALEVPGEPVTPKLCVERLWDHPVVAQDPSDMDMASFACEWNSGDIEALLFDPAYKLKHQRFGLEIEFTGMTRCRAAQVLARFFDTSLNYVGGTYDCFEVTDWSGRTWRVMNDGSILPCDRHRIPADGRHRCELVTPVCSYDDITDIQKIVRKLRHAGMVVNSSCGIHIHVDAEGHTARSLKNLANIMASKENLLFKALGIHATREHWCRKIDRRFLAQMQEIDGASSLDDVKVMWYDGEDFSWMHYDSTRYHMLNLHSLWQGKGIEFRMFNSVTHAGKIKAYIQLCLAISNQAKQQTWVSFREKKTTHEKRQFRTWLTRMGLVGNEFATARLHLLANLSDERTNAA